MASAYWTDEGSRYLAERTTIPLPRIYGYGFGGNYPTGLPFLILEYVDGHRLHDMGYATLDHAQKKHLYTQLADIFLQLRQQEFDHIGALTLDDNGAWTFARNRPLTIEINDGQVDGEDPAKLVQANQIYTSSWDFFLSLLSLAFHNLIQQRDVVESEQNARWQLYGLYQFRDLVKTWHLSHYDRGPFVLTHGDLSPANIIVDQDLCIKGVIDWEWSYTLPLQLVVPPTWLTGYQLDALYGNASREHDILREWSYFQKVVMGREAERAAEALASPLLSELWKDAVEGNSKDVMPGDSVFIAHTLLSWSHTPCVYWDRFASRDLLREERFLHFFDPTENMAAEDHLRLAAKKELDREGVQLIQNDRDFWWEKVNRPRSPLPPLSSEDARHLSTFVNGFGKQSPWIMGFFQFSRRAANSFLPLWSKLGQLVFEQQPSFITEKAITPASHVAGLVTFVAVFSWLLTWRRRTKCI